MKRSSAMTCDQPGANCAWPRNTPRTMLTASWRCTFLALVVLAAGCQSPFLVFPGGALKGEQIPVEDFAFASAFTLLRLEVNNNGKPYSVWLRTTVIDNELYIDAAPGRRWHQYIKADNRVRIALGKQVYPARAVTVADALLAERFLSGRTIYRIEPRPG